MCIRLTERYAVCKCVYYTHGVDPCQSVATRNHQIQERTVLVGHTCPAHAAQGMGQPGGVRVGGVLPDVQSGYR